MNIIHLSRKKLPHSPRPGKDYFLLQNPMTTDLRSGRNRTAKVMPAENDIYNPLLRFGRQMIFRWLTPK
jgi:hypothetical protein